LHYSTGKEKGAKKRLIYLFFACVLLEAEPGIEPRSTALQAAALLYISVGYMLCHSYCHSILDLIVGKLPRNHNHEH